MKKNYGDKKYVKEGGVNYILRHKSTYAKGLQLIGSFWWFFFVIDMLFWHFFAIIKSPILMFYCLKNNNLKMASLFLLYASFGLYKTFACPLCILYERGGLFFWLQKVDSFIFCKYTWKRIRTGVDLFFIMHSMQIMKIAALNFETAIFFHILQYCFWGINLKTRLLITYSLKKIFTR